jgi:hypothetical protein
VELVKIECSRPILRARPVISLAKFSSEPAMPSAMMMQPSFADWTMMPLSRSSTRIEEPSSANMVDPPDTAPPLRQAFSLTWNSSSNDRRPVSSA